MLQSVSRFSSIDANENDSLDTENKRQNATECISTNWLTVLVLYCVRALSFVVDCFVLIGQDCWHWMSSTCSRIYSIYSVDAQLFPSNDPNGCGCCCWLSWWLGDKLTKLVDKIIDQTIFIDTRHLNCFSDSLNLIGIREKMRGEQSKPTQTAHPMCWKVD